MDSAPSQQTFEIYKKALDAADKFDYFVCTVTGAVFGYEAERFSPAQLGLDFHLLELISILLLATSFWFGLEKLRYSILGTRINHQLNDSEEKSLQLARMLKEPEYQSETAQQMLWKDIGKHRVLVDTSNAQLPKANWWSRFYYIGRDIFLVAGFLAIVLARILQPYAANASATSPPPQTQLQQTKALSNETNSQSPQSRKTNQISNGVRP